ncbi:MAG TPA: SRPBCC family protein [Acidimicrobiales bacterium]|nr:SRPBCC family protein [Acidimicrobiales bacterium]
MPRIAIHQTIDAPAPDVWRRLADIGDHVSWMADAAAIRFTGDRRSGIGTAFECETRIGPLRTLDVMEVTEWDEGRALGVRHSGLVTGTGRFVLAAAGPDRSRLTWDEDLKLPWWLGGALGGLVARPLLRAVWRGNLRRLAARVAAGDGAGT